jgi:hypothetical protein
MFEQVLEIIRLDARREYLLRKVGQENEPLSGFAKLAENGFRIGPGGQRLEACNQLMLVVAGKLDAR